MLNLIRAAFLLFVTMTVFVGVNAAHAAPLAAGSDIRVSDGSGTTGGGEFTITVIGDIATFISFCLQHTEYIDFANDFNVDAISTYVVSDPASHGGDADGKDYLSAQTAFLYTQFRAGTLSGYNYSGTDPWSSADMLQNAIWMFEGEIAMIITNPFVILANTAFDTGAWTDLGSVRVMNLSLNGVESQDLLVLAQDGTTPVPEPASLVLFGTGASLAAMARRRRARRSAQSN